jgi:nitrogen regulatory protein P-II 2
MKLIFAIIKPFKLGDVRDALARIGVQGMTVLEVKGYGRQKGHAENYRGGEYAPGAEYAVNLLPKVQIEVAVEDDQADGVVEAICAAAKTGHIGDGKIFVTTIDHAVRIRTGETDTNAI